MALLDRFRTQPRQSHADPVVRLAFVQEIPIDERELLAEIALADPDGRVRRAAVAKLMDPAALARVVRGDAEESVRSAAAEMLRDIALEAFEDVTEADGLAAVEAVTDPRSLATVAKTSGREAIAASAVARVTDAHALGSVARHAPLEPIRRMAFEALQDRDEIFGVAMNSEYRDTAVAAVDSFVERETLAQIAARAKNKSAAKRARGLIRDMDERAAAEAAAVQPPADPDALAREESARQREEARMLAEREEAAERERADAETARRRAMVEDAQAAARRLQQDAAEQERLRDLQRRQVRLSELTQEAEGAAADGNLESAGRRLAAVRRQWRELAIGLAVDGELVARYEAAASRAAAREAEAREQDARRGREAFARVQQLLSRLEGLAAQADLSLKAGDRALRDIRTALADPSPLPSRRAHEEVVHRLKAAHAALTLKVQELRDVADWQRWANVGLQEQLCEKMEALGAVEDPAEIVRVVRDLQQQWRLAADVPRDKAEALWRRFKAAHDLVWTRCESHLAAEEATRTENLAKKAALCARAEALAESVSWIQTAEEIKRLQAEWKNIGAVTSGREKALWDRFRTACDHFFTRRLADLSERKKSWAANLAKKEALCVKAEALRESTDWEATAAEIRRLHTEWKAIGPVKKSRSESIWQRFRGAGDHFFVRYAQRHDLARGERIAAREAICAELETLAAVPETSDSEPAPQPPDNLPLALRTLRARWQQEIAARGVDRERAEALDSRFQSAFNGVLSRWPAVFAGTDFDPHANRKRMETLVLRVEDLARSVCGPLDASTADAALSPTTRLAAMLKEALAANTIGGKVDDESRLKAAAEEVRQAQSSWLRIGPAPEDARRALTDRFQRACRRIVERTDVSRAAQGPRLKA